MTIRNQSLLITYIVFVTKLQKKANPRKKYLPYWKFQIWNQGQDVSRIKGFPASWCPDDFIADHSRTQTFDKRI